MKKLASFFLALILCFTAAACDSKVPSSAEEPVDSAPSTSSVAEENKEPVTIEFWTLGLQPTFTDYINDVTQSFQEKYNGVTVKWVDLPWDGFQEKITASIGANKAPDVINVWTKLALSYASNNALLNLSEAATAEQLDVYQTNLLESNTLKGSVYGIPWYVTPPVCTYNTTLFEQAGLTSTPKDMDEMLEMSKTFKDKTGTFLFYPYEIIQVLFCNGIPLLNDDMTAAAFNTPEAADLLSKMQQSVQDGYLPKTDWNNWDQMIKLYSQNKLGMINLGAQAELFEGNL